MDTWFLPALLALPILGAIVCALLPSARAAKGVAFFFSLLVAALTLGIMLQFDWKIPAQVQFTSGLGEVSAIGFSFNLGVDSISLWLIALTAFLQPLVIAASFTGIQERQKEYYAWMLALQTAMLGVFMARDLLLFYVFFELTLIPMFFIIGIWGGAQRRYAAGKFFLFTFAGSIFTLAAIIYLGMKFKTFDIAEVVWFAQRQLGGNELLWILLGLLVGLAVKVPLFPVHTWLPLAHTEAPTAGSVILAGVLLKLGTYGILRLALPIGLIHVNSPKPVVFPIVLSTLGILCLIGIIYGALVAWVQRDIKKLVAYSSVSHLGFCVLGLVALNFTGIQGSILYMINHGLSTGAMFLVVGMIYERYHTRDIDELSGLGRKMPILSFFFVLFVLSSIGLPGLNGFVSEFLTILGAFTSEHLGIAYGVIAALGVILGALYMLHMTARVIFGPLKTPGHHAHGHEGHGQQDQGQAASPGHEASASTLPQDLSAREIGLLIPLAVAVIIIGVIPTKMLDTLYPPVEQMIVRTVDTPPVASASGQVPMVTAQAP